LPFADEVLQKVNAAYRPDATLGSAFRSLLQDLLADYGLLFLDPLAPEVRAVSAPLMKEVAREIPELVSALQGRNQELADAGYHAQVHVDRDTSLLFLLNGHKRLPVRWNDGQFVTREGSFSAAELAARAESISPNALLRPVMQDFLLPTVSYVGGPAEIAYLAQSDVLYQKLLGRMPVIFPRNSFTLLDTRAAKVLQQHRLGVFDVFDDHEHLRSKIAADLVPGNVTSEFASFRAQVLSSLSKLQSTLHDFDPTLESAAQKSVAKIHYQVDKLAGKTSREAMRRDARATGDAEHLVNLVYPQRHLQERFYSILPFLAEYGLDLPNRLLEETQLVCPDHMVRTL
jgi:bacillithiol biosynthesis cysteine-adding enzyme BshC